MFIKIEKDIFDVVLQEERSKIRERAIDVIVQLMTSSRMGLHKVYMKIPLTKEEEERIKMTLDENSRCELMKLLRERIDFEGLVSILDVYAVITNSKHCSRVGKILILNPFEADDFLLSIETYLATENQRDSLFYKNIAEFFKRNNKLSHIGINYRPYKGGGSDFGNTLQSDDILKRNFVFAIADSDKHFPKDKIGKTAKSIKFIGHNKYNADHYILNHVMEAENLIPYEFIKNEHSDFTNIAMYDLSYFDFKEGLKHTILYEKQSRCYWKNNFTNLVIDWKEVDELVHTSSTMSDYFDKVRGKEVLVPGYGSKLLESYLNNEKRGNLKDEDLTEAQLNEWKEIGKKVFSWTCCSMRKV